MSKKQVASKRQKIVGGSMTQKQRANLRTAGLLGIEHKYYDTYRSSVLMPFNNTTWAGCEVDPAVANCLNGIAQGDAAYNRDGKQISMNKIDITGVVTLANQTAETDSDTIGVIFIALVLDTQTNGAQLNSEDVYENPSGANYLAAAPFRVMENTKRFKVLSRVLLDPTEFAPAVRNMYSGTNSTFYANGIQVPWSMHVNLGAMKVNYKDGGGTVSSIMDNSLHIVAVRAQAADDPGCSIAYQSRVRFFG